MPLERKDIERALQKKGFVKEAGDHNFYVYWTENGKKTSLGTKTSHGTSHKTLSDGLVSLMAKQCGLSAKEFKLFVSCTISQPQFEDIVRDNNRLVD